MDEKSYQTQSPTNISFFFAFFCFLLLKVPRRGVKVWRAKKQRKKKPKKSVLSEGTGFLLSKKKCGYEQVTRERDVLLFDIFDSFFRFLSFPPMKENEEGGRVKGVFLFFFGHCFSQRAGKGKRPKKKKKFLFLR